VTIFILHNKKTPPFKEGTSVYPCCHPSWIK